MLKYLEINNLALIHKAQIDFDKKLNIISGETGAGKSILINALNLALGGRFYKNLLGNYAKKTIIFAIFDIHNHKKIQTKIMQMGFLMKNEDELSIKRIIDDLGQSKIYLNGKKITSNKLTQLSKNLIEIHSQNSQQSLLNSNFQKKLLDRYIKSKKIKDLKEIYCQIKHIENQIFTAKNNEINQEKKQLLEYYLEELQAADLDLEELETIEENYKKAANTNQICSLLNDANQILNENELNLNQQINQLKKTCEQIAHFDCDFAQNLELIEQSQIAFETIAENIAQFWQKIQSEADFNQIESRLNTLDKIANKHNCPINQLLQIQQKINEQLNNFDQQNKILIKLEEQKQYLIDRYKLIAKQISTLRKTKAKELETKIETRLKKLALEQAKLNIEIISDENKISQSGFDSIEFKISLNKLKPTPADFLALKKAASGGELSRVSLAIEVELADCLDIHTLVFDEIDAGIGGNIANQIGSELKQLAQKCQIICITHLAQIAVYASSHQVVEKFIDSKLNANQNTIDLKNLNNQKEKIEEIARMISGELSEKSSLEHAKNMINLAKKN